MRLLVGKRSPPPRRRVFPVRGAIGHTIRPVRSWSSVGSSRVTARDCQYRQSSRKEPTMDTTKQTVQQHRQAGRGCRRSVTIVLGVVVDRWVADATMADRRHVVVRRSAIGPMAFTHTLARAARTCRVAGAGGAGRALGRAHRRRAQVFRRAGVSARGVGSPGVLAARGESRSITS